MKKIGSGFVPFLVFSFLFLFVAAQGQAKVSVRATVDRNQVPVGGNFTLKVTVDSEKSSPINPPSLPTIENVQLLHSWTSSQSRSTVVSTGQGIDFKTVNSKIYSYQYTPMQEGTVNIDPIRVKVDGKTYQTKPIQIAVLAAGQGRPQAQRPQQGQQWPGQGGSRQVPSEPSDPFAEAEEMFNQLLRRQFGGVPGGGFQTEPPTGKDAFFIIAEVDKTEAYKGEQILASWYLYTRGRVRDIDTLKYPTLKGFWKEDIQIATHLNFEQDVINGVPYSRALLASYALFPIEEGKRKIDPYKAKATIVGGFGFGRGHQATKSSDNIPILVKPLPEEGKPGNFTGAVGEFQMTVDAPNKSIITHQPFPLRIRFEGRGNAKLIELPELPLSDNLEIYDIKNESKFFKNGQSFKEFEVLLIPNKPGPLKIDALKSSYFDPRKREYIMLDSDPIELQVLPGSKQQSIGEERLKADDEQIVLPGLVKEWNPEFIARSSKFHYWFILYALALLVVLGKLVKDAGWMIKNPTTEEIIAARFSKIEKHIGKQKYRAAGIEATNTVYRVLGELTGEGGSNQQLEKVLTKTDPSVRREIEEPLTKLMDFFGVLGFGPASFVKEFKDTKGLENKAKELKSLLLKACQLSKGNEEFDKKRSNKKKGEDL